MHITEPSTPGEYQHYYELRWKILRAPWGKQPGSEQDELEKTSTHLMAVDDDNSILGVGRLHFNSIQEAQIRYMAVAGAHQRTGIGTLLLNALELKAAALGATRISIDARETALRFYRKHGYGPVGPGQVLYNAIAHVKMTKNINL
jgi:predicted GNAT family N-acyltransferase